MLTSLEISSGDTITDPDEILNEIVQYYSELYSLKFQFEDRLNSFNTFVSGLNISTLSEE